MGLINVKMYGCQWKYRNNKWFIGVSKFNTTPRPGDWAEILKKNGAKAYAVLGTIAESDDKWYYVEKARSLSEKDFKDKDPDVKELRELMARAKKQTVVEKQEEQGPVYAGESADSDPTVEEQAQKGEVKTQSKGESKEDPLAKAVWEAVEPWVDIKIVTVEKKVEQLIAEQKPRDVKIEVKVDTEILAQFEGQAHQYLPEVLRRIAAGLKNVYLVGPAGCGKTHLATDVAKALKLQFASVSCTSGMPEWHLVGRATPNLTTGEQNYVQSRFVDCYENGGVVLLDEIDAADANTLLVLNSALANGHLDLPARTAKPRAERHEDFVLICAANTFGVGASRQYVGRNQLDASTLSRFAGATFEMDYDAALEKKLVPEKEIREPVLNFRKQIYRNQMRRVMGTREMIAAAKLFRAGYKAEEALGTLLVGYTPDELEKIRAQK